MALFMLNKSVPSWFYGVFNPKIDKAKIWKKKKSCQSFDTLCFRW